MSIRDPSQVRRSTAPRWVIVGLVALAGLSCWSTPASCGHQHRSPHPREPAANSDGQRARGKTHNPALRALSNRLVAILHGCLGHGQIYQESVAWGYEVEASA